MLKEDLGIVTSKALGEPAVWALDLLASVVFPAAIAEPWQDDGILLTFRLFLVLI